MNIDKIREEFPILTQEVYKRPLVYLDNAATTQKPRVVIDTISKAYCTINANVHRGVHHLSQLSTEGHEGGREKVRQFLNAKSTKEIIFTRGTTESINLVASSFSEAFFKEGDEVIISAMEHHSNIVPWQMLEGKRGIKLKVIPITQVGELDMEVFRSLITERTKLVSVAHVSNVLGTVNPIEEIIKIAHSNNVPVLIDGAQGAPHIKVDVQALDVDFYVFSGHKIYAPTGVGVLFGKEEWLEKMPPYQGGGEMIGKVTFEKTTYNELPFKFEAGTPDYVGVMAMTEALNYVEGLGIENIAAHETELLQYTTEKIKTIPGVEIYGNSSHKSGVISFNVEGIHPYDIGMLLDKQGVAVRTGHLCAQPLMDILGIPGVVRASFALYNTKAECDKFISALQRAIEICK